MDTNNFSHEESLKIINEMIERTRTRYEKGAGTPMMIIGTTIAVAAVAYAILRSLDVKAAVFVWTIFSIACLVIAFREGKKHKRREAIVKTEIDRISRTIGTGFKITFIGFLVILLASSLVLKDELIMGLMYPLTGLLAGGFLYTTGRLVRQPAFCLSGIVFWSGAALWTTTSLLGGGIQWSMIVLAAVALTGMTLPGYLMNRKARQAEANTTA